MSCKRCVNIHKYFKCLNNRHSEKKHCKKIAYTVDYFHWYYTCYNKLEEEDCELLIKFLKELKIKCFCHEKEHGFCELCESIIDYISSGNNVKTHNLRRLFKIENILNYIKKK